MSSPRHSLAFHAHYINRSTTRMAVPQKGRDRESPPLTKCCCSTQLGKIADSSSQRKTMWGPALPVRSGLTNALEEKFVAHLHHQFSSSFAISRCVGHAAAYMDDDTMLGSSKLPCCSICGRVYSRTEHLDRHLITRKSAPFRAKTTPKLRYRG